MPPLSSGHDITPQLLALAGSHTLLHFRSNGLHNSVLVFVTVLLSPPNGSDPYRCCIPFLFSNLHYKRRLPQFLFRPIRSLFLLTSYKSDRPPYGIPFLLTVFFFCDPKGHCTPHPIGTLHPLRNPLRTPLNFFPGPIISLPGRDCSLPHFKVLSVHPLFFLGPVFRPLGSVPIGRAVSPFRFLRTR